MEWLSDNALWLVVGAVFVWLHLKMHAGHGGHGHGSHGHGGHGHGARGHGGHGGCCGGGAGSDDVTAEGRPETEEMGHVER